MEFYIGGQVRGLSLLSASMKLLLENVELQRDLPDSLIAERVISSQAGAIAEGGYEEISEEEEDEGLMGP